MAAFIIYDSTTGEVRGAYTSAHHDDTDVMANNTPEGCMAMEVEISSHVFLDQKGWRVIDGVAQLVPPSPDELLAAARTAQNGTIEAAYQNATFATAISYMGTTFWADTDSQSKIMGLMVVYGKASVLPDGFMFWDATNNGVSMTYADMEGLAMAIAERENTNFVRRKMLLSQVQAVTTIAEVQAVSW